MVRPSLQTYLAGLRIAQAALVLAVLLAGGRFVHPLLVAPAAPEAADRAIPRPAAPAAAPATPALEAYAPIWQRNWKQPLIDPPPPAPRVEAPPPPPPVRVRLVGTAIENGTCYGFFQDENRRLLTRTVHETIGPFTIAAIERGKAQLVEGARTIWLEVPKAANP